MDWPLRTRATLDAYEQLLRKSLCLTAKGDRTRQLLLRPLLAGGTVAGPGGRPTAIVCPLAPVAYGAMVCKLVVSLVLSRSPDVAAGAVR